MNTRPISPLDSFKNFSFVLPAVFIFALFYIYPFIYTFFLSFQRYDFLSQMEFVGLANYKEILFYDESWWQTMYRGGFITFWALTFQNILALILALAVNRLTRSQKFYWVIFFLLAVLSEIIIGLLMQQILSGPPQGGDVLNNILNTFGLNNLTRQWLGSDRVLLTTSLVHCWKGFGWAFVLLFAGLQTIPEQLYEAARIDGASAFQCFKRITLPLLMPVIVVVMVLTILGTMQAFAMILALTRGAGGLTEVPVMRIYNHVRGDQVGLACAEGVVLGVILICVSFVMFFISKQITKKYDVLPH